MARLTNGYGLFALLFAFHVIWIFQGLDGYDLGFHLIHQVAVTNFEFTNSVPSLFFLSDFVGGLWLKLIGVPSLIWVRIGGIMLFCFSALLSYKVLITYFEKRRVFWVVFATSIFISGCSIRFLIEYFTFPAFLSALALYLFSQLLNRDVGSRSFKMSAFLLGFVLVAIVLARFTLVPILFAPLLAFSYYAFQKQAPQALKQSALYVTGGVLVAILGFGLFYESIGFLDTYFDSVKTQLAASSAGDNTQVSGVSYNMSSLITIYLREYVDIIKVTVVACILLFLASLARDRWGRNKASLILVALAATAFVMLLVTRDASTWVLADILNYKKMFVKIMIGLTLIVAIVFFWSVRRRGGALGLLVVLSTFVMIIHPFGSNTGVFKSMYGMWLALPLILLISNDIVEKMGHGRLKSMLSLNGGVISVLVIAACLAHFTNAHWDRANRFQLNTAFKYKYLRHVYGDRQRVEAVDQALTEIARRSQKDDELLMVRLPIQFYYLTQTRPFFDFTVSQFVYKDTLAIATMYRDAVANNRYPKLFVYTKKMPRHFAPGQDRLQAWLKNKYIKELGYEQVWQNGTYVIAAQPDRVRGLHTRVSG